MHRRGPSYDDGESLQADVMRFMAIIAFCLIAILALVKHAEPPTTETASNSPEPDQPQPVQAELEPDPEEKLLALAPPQPITTRIEPSVAQPDPAPEPKVEVAPVEVPEFTVEPVSAPAPEVEPEPQPASEPAVAAEPEEEGLILRFASDGDFLRLIARGDIRVYAFQDTDVLSLSETYRFLDTRSPGQVYELLPPSIPSLVVDALKQARTNIDGFHWGIALPGHISNQIERYLGEVTRGELVIDRYGDVHHVAAS